MNGAHKFDCRTRTGRYPPTNHIRDDVTHDRIKATSVLDAQRVPMSGLHVHGPGLLFDGTLLHNQMPYFRFLREGPCTKGMHTELVDAVSTANSACQQVTVSPVMHPYPVCCIRICGRMNNVFWARELSRVQRDQRRSRPETLAKRMCPACLNHEQ